MASIKDAARTFKHLAVLNTQKERFDKLCLFFVANSFVSLDENRERRNFDKFSAADLLFPGT